jgi:hypothetical protein
MIDRLQLPGVSTLYSICIPQYSYVILQIHLSLGVSFAVLLFRSRAQTFPGMRGVWHILPNRQTMRVEVITKSDANSLAIHWLDTFNRMTWICGIGGITKKY